MIHQQTININGHSIATQSSGSGKDAIVFIHGSSMSANTWLPQLQNSELKDKYLLIAFDLPGHNNSEWLKADPSGYRPRNLATLIKPILEQYSVERFLLAGLSYGTNIIGELFPPLPRCTGIMLVSPCIVNEDFPASAILTPGPNGHVIVAANPTDDELHDFVYYIESNQEIAARYIKTYRNTDPQFREQLAKSLMEGDLTDELENIKNWNLPVCVVFGKDEKLIKTDYLDTYPPLWKQQVFMIADSGHQVNEAQPKIFNEILTSFAGEVFR